jgi:hypothetical protein
VLARPPIGQADQPTGRLERPPRHPRHRPQRQPPPPQPPPSHATLVVAAAEEEPGGLKGRPPPSLPPLATTRHHHHRSLALSVFARVAFRPFACPPTTVAPLRPSARRRPTVRPLVLVSVARHNPFAATRSPPLPARTACARACASQPASTAPAISLEVSMIATLIFMRARCPRLLGPRMRIKHLL